MNWQAQPQSVAEPDALPAEGDALTRLQAKTAAVQGPGFAMSYCYTCPRPAVFTIGFGVLVWAGTILRKPRLCRWMLRRP